MSSQPPGELVIINRQTLDSILNDIGVVARLVMEIVDHRDEGGVR